MAGRAGSPLGRLEREGLRRDLVGTSLRQPPLRVSKRAGSAAAPLGEASHWLLLERCSGDIPKASAAAAAASLAAPALRRLATGGSTGCRLSAIRRSSIKARPPRAVFPSAGASLSASAADLLNLRSPRRGPASSTSALAGSSCFPCALRWRSRNGLATHAFPSRIGELITSSSFPGQKRTPWLRGIGECSYSSPSARER
mmetsp:Transcript_30595/g.99439  ORF Transcript_30595/g.99439 Transcript_30595/m.99439 type:complete len:200 (+) Transcript_30595:64-663(+)